MPVADGPLKRGAGLTQPRLTTILFSGVPGSSSHSLFNPVRLARFCGRVFSTLGGAGADVPAFLLLHFQFYFMLHEITLKLDKKQLHSLLDISIAMVFQPPGSGLTGYTYEAFEQIIEQCRAKVDKATYAKMMVDAARMRDALVKPSPEQIKYQDGVKGISELMKAQRDQANQEESN